MGFFTTSDNAKHTGTFDGGGSFELIPDGTTLTAMIDDASWDEFEGNRFIKLRWTVIDGEHKNRKIFQKIHAEHEEVGKRDRAIRMLAAIDINCGGALTRSDSRPDDAALQMNLIAKPMKIRVGVWDVGGKKGNFINAIGSQTTQAQTQAPKFDETF